MVMTPHPLQIASWSPLPLSRMCHFPWACCGLRTASVFAQVLGDFRLPWQAGKVPQQVSIHIKCENGCVLPLGEASEVVWGVCMIAVALTLRDEMEPDTLYTWHEGQKRFHPQGYAPGCCPNVIVLTYIRVLCKLRVLHLPQRFLQAASLKRLSQIIHRLIRGDLQAVIFEVKKWYSIGKM